ncbi:MAG: alpha/beta hydrolase [Clostridia bacterium]|nr:alpha/beta hydrolase [Clostridia bacterium]
MKEENIFKAVFKGIAQRFNGYKQEIGELSEEAGASPVAVASAKTVYDSFFKRYERPDYSLVAGLYCRERIKDVERRELWIPHGALLLKGYFYPAKRSKGTVVLVHGIRAGADDYIPLALKFIENGYDIFSYDGTGTYDSEGDGTVGLSQGLVDLNGVLTFVKGEKFKKPLFLVGHSCGGYAVTSVLALHKGISACAAIAPPNNCFTLILEKGKQYAGGLAAKGLTAEFLDVYQRRLFGSFSECSAVKGINAEDIPVVIAHGLNDKVISFGKQSVIAHKHEITNEKVSYYLGTGRSDGHDSVWHSSRAAEYKEEIDAQAKELKKDERAAFFEKIDHALYSEVNEELFQEILTAFEKS